MARKLQNHDEKIFCSNCARKVEKEAESCEGCNEFFENELTEVRICPTCGCPLETEDEYEQFKEDILGENIDIDEVQWILKVLDNMLEDLPEEKVEDFAESEDFELYEKVLEAFDV